MNRKGLFCFVCAILCCLTLSACGTKTVVASPMVIEVDHLMYEEVTGDQIRKLGIAVENCEGLTIAGAVEDAGRETVRMKYDNFESEPEVTNVKTPDMAYVHPNPSYPNLVVALVDGEPAVFQFCNSIVQRVTPAQELREKYGLTSADAIREIRIRSREAYDRKAVTYPAITDRKEIERFYDVFSKVSGNGCGYGDDGYDNNIYYVDVSLANGFSFDVWLYHDASAVSWGGLIFVCPDDLDAWICSHAK